LSAGLKHTDVIFHTVCAEEGERQRLRQELPGWDGTAWRAVGRALDGGVFRI